jgi:polysaccharide biosynthesis protein PslG
VRLRLLALTLAMAALTSGCGGDDQASGAHRAQAGPPADFLGIVTEDSFGAGSRYRKAQVRRQRRLGLGIVRQTFDWRQIERRRGRFSLGRYDRFVADLAYRRMRVLPILFNPPRFHSSRPRQGARRGTYPPRDPESMGDFAAALVRRYGPRGSFWRARPRLPKLPVRSWQVWNEPSIPVYWPSGPDPTAYVSLLRSTGRAIKRVDPGAEIVSAGLANSRLGMPFRRFVSRMYDAGAADAFDTFALHAYSRSYAGLQRGVEDTRALIAARGDRASIWITEIGWASGGPRSPFTVGESRQARLIGQMIRSLGRARSRLGIRGVVYFNWRDSRPFAGGREFFGLHTGLLRRNGSAKPALGAFARAARALRR